MVRGHQNSAAQKHRHEKNSGSCADTQLRLSDVFHGAGPAKELRPWRKNILQNYSKTTAQTYRF
jgi:hypothetical protein